MARTPPSRHAAGSLAWRIGRWFPPCRVHPRRIDPRADRVRRRAGLRPPWWCAAHRPQVFLDLDFLQIDLPGKPRRIGLDRDRVRGPALARGPMAAMTTFKSNSVSLPDPRAMEDFDVSLRGAVFAARLFVPRGLLRRRLFCLRTPFPDVDFRDVGLPAVGFPAALVSRRFPKGFPPDGFPETGFPAVFFARGRFLHRCLWSGLSRGTCSRAFYPPAFCPVPSQSLLSRPSRAPGTFCRQMRSTP